MLAKPYDPDDLTSPLGRMANAVRDNPDLKLIVLGKHGLIVWGDSAEEAYRRTIEVINRAATGRTSSGSGSGPTATA